MKRIYNVILFLVLITTQLVSDPYSGPKVSAIIPADGKGNVYNAQWFNFAGATQWGAGNSANVRADTASPIGCYTDSSPVDSTGAFSSGRYADADHYIIYELTGVSTNLFRIDLKVGNDFKIGLMTSTNGSFYEVLNSYSIFNAKVTTLDNFMYQTIDPNYFIQNTGTKVYLKIIDRTTGDGWGGKIGALYFRNLPIYQNGEIIKFNVYTDKTNYTVTADFSQLEGSEVSSPNNGYVTNLYPVQFTIPSDATCKNGIYHIPVKIYNPSYSPDTYIAYYIIGIQNPIIGYFTNNKYKLIYGWNWGESGSYNETNALIENNNSQTNTEGNRFADATSYFIYRFRNIDYKSSILNIEVAQNYKIELSKDKQNWIELSNCTNDWGFKSANNRINLWQWIYYPGDYFGAETGDLYIKFSDLTTNDGWGPICSAVKLIEIPQYENGENIVLQFKIKFGNNISSVKADCSYIDSAGGWVSLTNNGGYYMLNYTLSKNNTKQGLCNLPVKINLSTGGYKIYYLKLGINYNDPQLYFDTLSISSNITFYLKTLKSWQKVEVAYSSNQKTDYSNMISLTTNTYSYFEKALELNIPYYFGIRGMDTNSIRTIPYYFSAVKINQDTEKEFYFYQNNSSITVEEDTIYGTGIIYFNKETKGFPSGINGIDYYRISFFHTTESGLNKPYKIKLYYSDDNYDTHKLTIYVYKNNRWLRLNGTQNTAGTGGFITAWTKLSGWFAIAEDNQSLSDKYVLSTGFSPDGDGVNDTIIFNIPVSTEKKISIEIYDIKGKLVKVVQPEINIQPPGSVLEWDGRDDKGDLLPPGVYIYKIRIGSDTKKGIFTLIR